MTNHIVVEKTSKIESICKKIHSLPVRIERKAYMASAIVLGGTLCGAEVDHLTKNNLHRIRQALGMATWGNKGPRNKVAALLLHTQGQIEPTAKRVMQLGGHWQRMVNKNIWEGKAMKNTEHT